MKLIKIFTIFFISTSCYGQSKILMDACNKIENENNRLICFEEILKIKSQENDDSEKKVLDKVKKSFYGLKQLIKQGVSYTNYSNSVLEFTKEVGFIKNEPSLKNSGIVKNLEQAIDAYNDAGKIWYASIFHTQDAGIFFGNVLNPDRVGLSEIVNKYNLETTSILGNRHLPYDLALNKIWKYADEITNKAFSYQNQSASNPVPIPENGEPDKYATQGWSCKSGFTMIANRCDKKLSPNN